MGLRQRFRNRLLDFAMRRVNELRPDALCEARGEVLEVGFGSALNLAFYPEAVSKLVALDPKPADELPAFADRMEAARFPVERCGLPADGGLPFDAGRFDTVVTTWTLCSIPDARAALLEMRRVLRPGGRYCFIEHGRAPGGRIARWQDRLDPLWCRIADGCHMNRRIEELVSGAGFEIQGVEHFRHEGPSLLSQMFRGVAIRAN
ncbi:MAG: class I SAM-dependent methyltransferase [Myxococcota bacterium]